MFAITYHPDVAGDIARLGTSEKKRIREVIENKLVVSPLQFGKPLQHSLSGLRSLRVGDYRVVFKLADKSIIVLLIAHFSVVYAKTQNRVCR